MAITFPWRKPGVYPNGEVFLRKDGNIALCFYPEEKQDGFMFKLNKRDARMLARRILQCLEYHGR